nr:Wzz/FepE/Etk N-terminal domain-containing protein [Polymorphobacter sp.]
MTLATNDTSADPADETPKWVAGALATLRARIWLVALVMALCLAAAVIYLRNADYTYTAALRIAPAPASARESTGLGALGNLASLTGVTLESLPATPFRLYVEGVSSREVAVRLANDPELMHRAFAREWDARNRRWDEPASLTTGLRNAVLGLVGAPVPRWSAPDAARLQSFLATRIGVNQNPKTPLVTISMDTTDRQFGIKFLTRLNTTIDTWLREKTLARTNQNIAYLTGRLPGVTQADHRQALFATLSAQEQRLMMARNPAAFAAETFGQIGASSTPTSPRQVPILTLALALGLIFGLVLALVIPRKTA